ncbi:hypothetical protein WJX79_000672 [Trebouxia sp. C0005]
MESAVNTIMFRVSMSPTLAWTSVCGYAQWHSTMLPDMVYKQVCYVHCCGLIFAWNEVSHFDANHGSISRQQGLCRKEGVGTVISHDCEINTIKI